MNLADLIIVLLIVLALGFAIRVVLKNKKQVRQGCNGNCGSCGGCH